MADPSLGYRALTRFGLGPRGDGDLAIAAGDPRGFVRAELSQPGVALLDGPGLMGSVDALKAHFAEQEERKRERERVAAANAAAQPMAQPAMAPPSPAAMPLKEPPKPPSPDQQLYRFEAGARLQRALQARVGFVERLIAFWSNHFAVSVAKGGFVRAVAGAYEREVIRPHALGRFADMLMAVERHPAMQVYLDNSQSVGPDSKAGANRKRGLNENLAREILELHTLGVGGGYSQADVGALARIITGWGHVGPEGRLGEPGTFRFNANAHEPGAQVLLGKTYAQPDVTQGEAAILDLARHPATARFIATKLARHFVADEPPPALVAKLEKTFRDTDGDLRAVSLALVESDAAWSAPPLKMRDPWQFLVAVGRVAGRGFDDVGQMLNWLRLLGMPLWHPPGPNGYSDLAAVWAAPENMKLRLDLAARFAERLRDVGHPSDFLEKAVGPAASQETRLAVAQAESRQQGLALLLLSPEMQRR